MISGDTPAYAETVLGGLKGFQRKTAEYAFHRLYGAEDSTRRFLIADEVGLGKTLVAAGVIAQAIDHLRTLNTPRIDVIYICSNQAIARQNLDRIRQRLSIETKPLAERLTLLPHRLDTLDQPVNLIALTPGTSFSSTTGEGIVEERVILFRLLTEAWGDLGCSAREVFRGNLDTLAPFRRDESRFRCRLIDRGILKRFRSAVGGPGSALHLEFIRLRDLVAEGQDGGRKNRRRTFIFKLRRLLAQVCIDALKPNMVILDEFQRFRELMDKSTESGKLAKRLIENEDRHTKVRTLLLSATPYKMYTLSHESDENHYQDFLETVHFLGGSEAFAGPIEESLRGLRAALSDAATDRDIGVEPFGRLADHRDTIQGSLLRVMSRTERRGGASGGDPMLQPKVMSVDLKIRDVEAYLRAREVAATMDAPGVMEYWKSTPYLLSFMDRYKLSQSVRDNIEREPNGKVAQLIRHSRGLQIHRKSVEQRRSIPGGNGRMRALLRDLVDSRLHRALWMPPSLPEHILGRDFERARIATKRLVFSSWAMVPRAVAVMASYDAERRYVGERERARQYESRLLPVKGDAYSLFALMAPSEALAKAGDPLRYEKRSARELLKAIEERLRPKIAELIRDAPTEGSPQGIWYAVAPLLLDRQSRESIKQWLRGPAAASGVRGDAEPGTWEELTARVVDGVADPASLGRPPGDLAEVLAALAAGSPANATLRALSRTTVTPASDNELKAQAITAAWAFRQLFRAPTSEGLLRNLYRPAVPGGGRKYWRRVLAYALEGGLTAVLEEYFHVIHESKGAEGGAAALVDTLCQALRLATGTLEVSHWEWDRNGVRRETFTMRQHFARRYSSDGLSGSDHQASQHLDTVRAAFNSPFWPFVLGTTSIGQEGLDFHWYCHAVVHWNLPPNPVDLEQREGRVNRYHGHAIRKNIAQVLGPRAIDLTRAAISRTEHVSPWELVYQLADDEFSGDGGLVPHWVFTRGNARIQRHSPVLPLSRDADRVDALRRSLAVYRMVFGQPRQDDLLEFILRKIPEDRRDGLAKALTIDLSPPV